MSNVERYTQLNKILTDLEEDFEKFYDARNKAAGTRIRKGMMELKNLAQEIRNEVQTLKSQNEEG